MNIRSPIMDMARPYVLDRYPVDREIGWRVHGALSSTGDEVALEQPWCREVGDAVLLAAGAPLEP